MDTAKLSCSASFLGKIPGWLSYQDICILALPSFDVILTANTVLGAGGSGS